MINDDALAWDGFPSLEEPPASHTDWPVYLSLISAALHKRSVTEPTHVVHPRGIASLPHRGEFAPCSCVAVD